MKPARAVALALLLCACDGEIDERIGLALKGTAEKVTLTDTHVQALCIGGDVAKVPVSELGLDFLGMADIEKQTLVAKQLSQQCEGFLREKAEDKRSQSVLAAAAKELDLELTGPLEEQRALLCQALKARLPLRGPGRAEAIARHSQDFACEDPGEPELGPERYWRVEEKGKGKQAAVYLRLEGEPVGELRDQLTIRCRAKGVEVYLETEEAVGKGPLLVTLDGKKGRWPTRASKSGKAIFVSDAQKGVRALLGKKRLELRYPGKGKVQRAFEVEGLDAAIAPHKRRCRA